MIFGKVFRMMSHLGGELRMIPGGKAIEPLQKEKQSKNQMNQKKKKRAKNQAVTNSYPLKEISSSRFSCSGNKYDLRTPFPTRVSFFLYLLFPQEFQMINLPCSGVVCFPFPKFWRIFAHLPNIFVDVNFLISAVISNGSEHRFFLWSWNLFTSDMGLLQINTGLLVSINAKN